MHTDRESLDLHFPHVLCALKSAPTPGNPVSEWHLQCPVLSSPAQLLQAVPVASIVASIHHILGLPIFLLPSISPSITIFFKECCTLPHKSYLQPSDSLSKTMTVTNLLAKWKSWKFSPVKCTHKWLHIQSEDNFKGLPDSLKNHLQPLQSSWWLWSLQKWNYSQGKVGGMF